MVKISKLFLLPLIMNLLRQLFPTLGIAKVAWIDPLAHHKSATAIIAGREFVPDTSGATAVTANPVFHRFSLYRSEKVPVLAHRYEPGYCGRYSEAFRWPQEHHRGREGGYARDQGLPAPIPAFPARLVTLVSAWQYHPFECCPGTWRHSSLGSRLSSDCS